jgi:hypothetical protein
MLGSIFLAIKLYKDENKTSDIQFLSFLKNLNF